MRQRWWTRAVVAADPRPAPAITLRRVAQVRADQTYDIPDHDYPTQRWIACRTVSGSGSMRLADGRELVLTPATVVVMRQRDLRAFHCVQAPWLNWWFEFLGASPLPAGRVLSAPVEAEVSAYAACLRLLTSRDPSRRVLASARFATLLAGWACAQREPASDADRVDRVLAAMHDHPDGSLSMLALAQIAGVGERRLRQLFHAAVGSPPARHYAALRAELAAQLLHEHRRPVAEVAETLGFADRFALGRAVRIHLGTTPGRLRRLCVSRTQADGLHASRNGA
jgi:AraC-like DNA-binding protein